MWMPALLAMAARDDWAVIPLVKSNCNPGVWLGKGYANTPQDLISRCHAWYQWAVGQAKALHPDVTLMTGCCGGLPASGDQTTTDERRGFSSLGTAMKSFSTSVILMPDNDGVSKQPVDCLLARGATMRTCTTSWPAARFGFTDGLAKLAKARGFGFLKTRGWFCYQRQCPMVVSHTIVYRDLGHITQSYALALSAVFRSTFRSCILDVCPR
jgi:hypothetical protein